MSLVIDSKYSLMKIFETRLFATVMAPLDTAKKLAAYRAVNQHVKNNQIIGIGSGSTIVYAVERLGQRYKQEKLNIKCIPTSFQSRKLLIEHNLPISDLEIDYKLDVCIDGADEVDKNLNLIKGGGGCLLQEKIIASCSNELIIVADYTKNSMNLGDQYMNGIPIEVVPLAYKPVQQKIQDLFGGQLELRMAIKKAGPVITDNGNFILDWKDYNQNLDWGKINSQILTIPGVVETGLFIKMASKAYFGLQDGTVKEQI